MAQVQRALHCILVIYRPVDAGHIRNRGLPVKFHSSHIVSDLRAIWLINKVAAPQVHHHRSKSRNFLCLKHAIIAIYLLRL